ncbi:D-ribose pyranase [Aerococcus viridans]|uniref:D-ribose pyranase n=1 Tax=Aerococcus viridans TaxID=1377 RepID=UPI003AA8717A
MKKNGILNSEISKLLSDLGHTDQITIADAGLPVPDGIKKIDLALKLGTPSFIEVLEEVLKDMAVEKVILAEEIKVDNESQLDAIQQIVDTNEVAFVSHEAFKKQSGQSKAIIRTGEATPFSNIILQSNVIF